MSSRHVATPIRIFSTALSTLAWVQYTSCSFLTNFRRAYCYPACGIPSAMSVMSNSPLPHHFAAIANAHDPYYFHQLFSISLRVLGPSALDISNLSLVQKRRDLVLILNSRRKMLYLFLPYSESVIRRFSHTPPQTGKSTPNITATCYLKETEALRGLFILEEGRVHSSARTPRAYVAEPLLIPACRVNALVFLPCLNTPDQQ